ncbi:unnamed protein product [Lactuca virosa]|uniref:Uncharacterized protein n=1 Tax=Lactuca virosa TaxID=75947 RepID=A0AAU9N0M7_9ASTR|nr:unnamed protein product [Lactuca virosa]
MKVNKFSNTFEEAINLDDDDFVNIHSGGSSVVMLSRESLAKKKVKCHFEKGESSVSVCKKNKRKDEHYEDSEADLDVNVRRSGRKKTKVIKNEVLKEVDNKKRMKKRKSKIKNVVENEDVAVEDNTTKELPKISCRMSPKSMYMVVKGMSYSQKEMLTYADKVVLNGYNLRRSRPLIKQIDSVDLEMLEEHGLRMGKFVTLEFRGDGEVDLIDVNGDEDKLVGVESTEMLYCRICDDKKKKLRKQLRRG